jgi:hypothetical protein
MSFMDVQMARHKGSGGYIAEQEDRAVTIRPSSSANFYVDSLDKLSGSSGDFIINKNQSLFNGFFNRIAVSEVVVDWGIPNVAAWWGNNTISVTNASGGTLNVTIPDGFYTAIQCLQQVAAAVNTAAIAAGNALRLSVSFDGFDVKLVSTGTGTDAFYFNWTDGVSPPYLLARQLFTSAQLVGAAVQDTEIVCASPRILGTTYIDIVSDQLTYNQDLKDATTDVMNRDVLYRWYFANDNVPQVQEEYPLEQAAGVAAPAAWLILRSDLPILQGYAAFVSRRALPVPKQIRWDPTAPIGQVGFQVYDDRGRLIDTRNFPWSSTTGRGGANFQFQMSMLLSEN